MIGGWSPGALVGAYRLERELGRGGMGVVFLAQDTATGAAVVIKTLTTSDPDEVARLEREGLALARLEHPHLIRVHGAGWHERRPYLVLQYASGGSLADRLQRGPLPWAEAVELGARLASALAAAHAVGIRHRDLKPENVLLDERGSPLLADFGLAKVTDLSRLTETGALLGTPLYMAPEQAIRPRLGRGRRRLLAREPCSSLPSPAVPPSWPRAAAWSRSCWRSRRQTLPR